MSIIHLGFALFVLATVLVGLGRALLGPTPGDTMTAAQLFGTSGIAVLLVLAETWRAPALRDAALVVALLAVLATLVFVRQVWTPEERSGP